MSSASNIKRALQQCRDPKKAAFFPRFFKAGKGEYAEGDIFIGVTVPQMRAIAKLHKDLPLKEISTLLKDPIHEYRLTALLILGNRAGKADKKELKTIADFYLKHMTYVNNWDLVDSSCYKILGPFLEGKPRTLLDKLAKTRHLWSQRIAMVTTYHFIRKNEFADTVRIASLLLNHPHDLMHKAVGWMLREMGKRDEKALEAFLEKYAKKMPRTALRYAIERFPEKKRLAILRSTRAGFVQW